jgi:hypothetical protein
LKQRTLAIIVIPLILLLSFAAVLYSLPIYYRNKGIDYYKGFMIPPQGGRNIWHCLQEIWRAKQLGMNIISIHPEYDLDENGCPRISPLWGEDKRWGENWRRNLIIMINYAHILGLRVEIKNAEVWGRNGVPWDDLEEKPNPEDYISGYLEAAKELAEIAETYNVYQFCIWSEVDHIVMQGKYGKIDLETVRTHRDQKDLEKTITDWSRRMLNIIKERFSGKIGVGFSGILDNLAYYQNADIKGFDFIEFSFYSDTFDDYITNTPANALLTIEAYRRLAERNGINTIIIGETALEEKYPDTPLSSLERQNIYHRFFEATNKRVNGYILNSVITYYNYDRDLEVAAKEWYEKL